MSRFVICADVAVELARQEAAVCAAHQILAPAVIRSQVLSRLYQAVMRSEMSKADADRRLEYVRGLRMRLLGDRVLQSTAWRVAALLGWQDTLDAEYVALTQLHADAMVTLDAKVADAARRLVAVAPIDALLST